MASSSQPAPFTPQQEARIGEIIADERRAYREANPIHLAGEAPPGMQVTVCPSPAFAAIVHKAIDEILAGEPETKNPRSGE